MRKIVAIKDCMKTFEGDGIPVTRAFPVPEMRENDPIAYQEYLAEQQELMDVSA